MSTINPEKLIFLRKEAGLTAEALADAAHVGRATITRIENGKAGAPRTETVKRLANTLKCQPRDLFTPPEPDQARSLFNDRTPLDLSISTAAQNALELVAMRYNETRETILELAPLLFDLVARESLFERRERLAELSARRDAVAEMGCHFSHLGGRFLHDWQAEEVEVQEETSIRRRDLRASYVLESDSIEDAFVPLDYDEECDNPFVDHLKRRMEEVRQDGDDAPSLDVWPVWRSPSYDVGSAEALILAQGDEKLARSILTGAIQLARLPKNLRSADADEARLAWMRQQKAQHEEKLQKLLGDLLIDVTGSESA
jgi:transcriptional regulator with XRE-family HTH domain